MGTLHKHTKSHACIDISIRFEKMQMELVMLMLKLQKCAAPVALCIFLI